MKNFAITGVAGYIAPRHLKAIKETGNNLIACLDPHDSVGIIDSYFPNADYFREFERFERHLERLRHKHDEKKIDYLSICAPNHLHDSHIRLALRVGANAICEKPLVLNPWNIEALEDLEKEFGKKVYTILQLRVHPRLLALKEKTKIEQLAGTKKKKVVITYITSRGSWYHFSWKGDAQKSGGIATNIGIHFFDLVLWLFGKTKSNIVHLSETSKAAGYLELEYADVSWYLSVDKKDLPEASVLSGKATYRSITIDGEEVEFTDGFTDLHTLVYQETIDGRGFGLNEVKPSIELAHAIRHAEVEKVNGEEHPWLSSRVLNYR